MSTEAWPEPLELGPYILTAGARSWPASPFWMGDAAASPSCESATPALAVEKGGLRRMPSASRVEHRVARRVAVRVTGKGRRQRRRWHVASRATAASRRRQPGSSREARDPQSRPSSQVPEDTTLPELRAPAAGERHALGIRRRSSVDTSGQRQGDLVRAQRARLPRAPRASCTTRPTVPWRPDACGASLAELPRRHADGLTGRA